jgi:DtxR family transcriptional regulator, Mn-dependent transcriptional regulator
MTEILTQSIQDYLKQIYELNENGDAASTTQIAERLNVAPASVTGMLQKLASARLPLVQYKKHKGATLTKAGERAALEVIRHHRLLETYLVSMLGYSWDEVHDEACRLEHVISEDFESRIASVLGNPSRDPHGAPIPDINLSMPTSKTQRLLSLRTNESAAVTRVPDDDPALLRYLHEVGVVPEARVSVLNFSELDGNLTLLVEGHESNVVLGIAITSQIYINKDEPAP